MLCKLLTAHLPQIGPGNLLHTINPPPHLSPEHYRRWLADAEAQAERQLTLASELADGLRPVASSVSACARRATLARFRSRRQPTLQLVRRRRSRPGVSEHCRLLKKGDWLIAERGFSWRWMPLRHAAGNVVALTSGGNVDRDDNVTPAPGSSRRFITTTRMAGLPFSSPTIRRCRILAGIGTSAGRPAGAIH